MTSGTLIWRYTLFAVIATLVNLGAQRLVLFWGQSPLFFAAGLAVGTAAGLVVKYVLDKRWIFFDYEGGIAAHGRKFSLYTAMGLVTTAIFWGSETLCWVIWHNETMREVGAVVGLGVGYLVKYQLDRRFVFATPSGPARA